MTIVSGRAATESSCQHRTVERDELAADREKCEHRREIAVSDERLPRAACLIAEFNERHVGAIVHGTIDKDGPGPFHFGGLRRAATFVTKRLTGCPGEIVFESRAYSPQVEARWGISDPLSTLEKEGAAAPLRRYWQPGETQSFRQVVFDDLVLDDETELRLDLHADEIDNDWRYGVFETTETPSYNALGAGTIQVSTRTPGTYSFRAGDWGCVLQAGVVEYPFGTLARPIDVRPPLPPAGPARLTLQPNPFSANVHIAASGLTVGGTFNVQAGTFNANGQTMSVTGLTRMVETNSIGLGRIASASPPSRSFYGRRASRVCRAASTRNAPTARGRWPTRSPTCGCSRSRWGSSPPMWVACSCSSRFSPVSTSMPWSYDAGSRARR